MSGFSAQWLALREPYDVKARNAAVLDAVAAAFQNQSSISVVDLACGTGATVRAIGARLPLPQSWRLVDNNLSLLAQAADLGRPPALTVAAQPVDLARDLELALDGPTDLVTTSALLDLVSAEWVERLAVEAAARRLPVYAALTYQGRGSFERAGPVCLQMVSAARGRGGRGGADPVSQKSSPPLRRRGGGQKVCGPAPPPRARAARGEEFR